MHNLGIIKQSIELSWENIRSNKMRTFLTTLGIIIGVTAVISLITIVNGVIATVMDEFSSLGAGTLTVSISGTPLKSGLTESDLEELEALDNVEGISPSVSLDGTAARNQTLLEHVSIQGKSDYYYHGKDLITAGRALNRLDVETESYVCVIDQDIADSLFAGENPVGQILTLNGESYTVIGLEGSNSDLMASMSGFGSVSDGTVTIPYTTAGKMEGGRSIRSLEIYIENTDYTDQLVTEVEGILSLAFNGEEDSYSVFAMDSLLDTMNSMMGTFTYMLAGIASIALLVGGIGIMNMMLVSVSERTKEIGLRKAMGADPGRIQMQFLIEAIFLSLLGGLIGVVLGLLLSFIVAMLLDTGFVFSASAVALGMGFSMAVGVVFGWAPARKASRLSPIDALRSE